MSTRTVVARIEIEQLLTYSSDEIEITPAPLVPTSDSGKVWKSDPVQFDPLWLPLPLADADRQFKVDMAGYGVMEDGRERRLTDPYELGLFDAGDESVPVIRLEEIAAEKTLGWCAHRQYKHLADLAYIASRFDAVIDGKLFRDVLDRKLSLMSGLQPDIYQGLDTVDDLIAVLEDQARYRSARSAASSVYGTLRLLHRSYGSFGGDTFHSSSRRVAGRSGGTILAGQAGSRSSNADSDSSSSSE